MYEDKLQGKNRTTIKSFSDIQACTATGHSYSLTLLDTQAGTTEQLPELDAVVLATGFRNLGTGAQDECFPAILRDLKSVTGPPRHMLDALRLHELRQCFIITGLRKIMSQIDSRRFGSGVGQSDARDRHLESEIDAHPFHEMPLLFDRVSNQRAFFETFIGKPLARHRHHRHLEDLREPR